ncbi:MAG: cation:proton antiporter [Anaerolineales bacterium]|nr:cation:proton antiporter [Anaerolineales bacterium]NUQ84000.1 cation:proton antiporter [Anaerolineales bacterium]
MNMGIFHSIGLLSSTEGETSSLLPLLLALAILIASAKLAGALAVKIGQPAVLGELMAGLLLGPTALDLFRLPFLYDPSGATERTILQLAQLGVIFLMFSAGLETELNDLRKSGRPAFLAGLFGMILPILLTAFAALPFVDSKNSSILLGIVLAATSVSISVQTLIELKRMRTPEGMALLGAAVVDDVLVILSLSIFVSVVGGGGENLGVVILRMILTLLASGLIGYLILPRIAEWANRLPISQGMMALVIVSALLFSWSAEFVGGIAAITGAFIAGVGLGQTHWREEITRDLQTMNYAFFVPLFLVGVGLQANVRDLGVSVILLAAVLIVVAIASKIIGCGLGARLGGFSNRQALRVGVGMISRGEVGLIVAGVGQGMGLLTAQKFTVIVLVVLVTTLITPPLLRWAFGKEGSYE